MFPPDDAIVSCSEADTIEANEKKTKMLIIFVIVNSFAIFILTKTSQAKLRKSEEQWRMSLSGTRYRKVNSLPI